MRRAEGPRIPFTSQGGEPHSGQNIQKKTIESIWKQQPLRFAKSPKFDDPKGWFHQTSVI